MSALISSQRSKKQSHQQAIARIDRKRTAALLSCWMSLGIFSISALVVLIGGGEPHRLFLFCLIVFSALCLGIAQRFWRQERLIIEQVEEVQASGQFLDKLYQMLPKIRKTSEKVGQDA